MNIHEKFFSKIGANYLILGVTAIIFQIILINILNATHPEYLGDINIISLLSSICNYILPFPIFYWLMKKLDAVKIEKRSVDAKTFLIYISITITLMWIGNIIGLIITMLLSGAIQSDISNPVQELINSTDILFNLVIICIMAPIFEEIFFRKLLIDRTIKYGAKLSIILSALLFGLFHGNLNQFFYAFLMGGFFAYVYVKTGKITYTIILHAIVNLMGSVISIQIANAAMNLQTAFNPIDLLTITIYLIALITFLIIGTYGLTKFDKAKFNGEKTEISLKKPLKTMLVNYGMILFILFFIIEMIIQIFGLELII
ncbi:CPBP family intramembrane glutamic endopeptidase [Methanobrevibacter sp.]|uniref:CPBP family intramembrane glutamic endopeptidase n=1 Tax=Methanobrevibacter sp. TaxID=66852 RepID=UPI0025CD456A|nr:CPBP family intramembrane glutamic endopeptidase [Methanobrevibacter sp.]MBQ2665610.1 CPBP family intramembrane metalloprotease [Methanobrevibacter sp.]